MKKNMICICCPIGCNMNVEMKKNKGISVVGNTCERGKTYAINEMLHPTRMITTTIEVENGSEKMLSVKTKEPIPKEKIFECMDEIKILKIKAPIKIGDIVINDIAKTKIAVVATKNIKVKK